MLRALPRSRRALAGLLTCAALTACAAPVRSPAAQADQNENELHPSPLPKTSDGRLDHGGGAWRMIDVPAASNAPSIVRTPDAWLALSSRGFGGKYFTGGESVLYRSIDGVSWQRIALTTDNRRSLAYGNGRYVIVGRTNAGGAVWTSEDALHWSESAQQLDTTQEWRSITFAGGRFLAFGFRVLGVSEDGSHWQKVTVDLLQQFGLAHGNGRFLMTGSGPVISSEDGLRWQSHAVTCSLPDACITDPGGGSHTILTSPLLFAEGKFFTGRIASPDGVTWSAASPLAPSAYVDGHFFSSSGFELASWTTGGTPSAVPVVRPSKAAVTAAGRAITSVGVLDHDAPLPEHVSTAFADGLSCANSACVLIAGRLFLVPPPGSAALPDKTPRNADGQPLLSDDCPVSRLVFCNDYTARTGCSCHKDAPRAPSFCDDVSQFTCAGKFTPRAEEWQVDDLAEAGCSCTGTDPNQPPTLGLPCDADANVCKAPLTCLPVQPEFSGGPPGPQPLICTAACSNDGDCPSWQATGFCAGPVKLACTSGSCQPRTCE